MGAVLSAGLAANLLKAANDGSGALSVAQAEAFAANPNALVDPQAQSRLPVEALEALRAAMAAAIHKVFWVGAVLSALSLLVILFLPRSVGQDDARISQSDKDISEQSGEQMALAE